MEVKEAARRAIGEDMNQYSRSEGSVRLCAAIAEKLKSFNGIQGDPQEGIIVTCGAAEAITTAVFSIVDPGDEVIIIEPIFENYVPAVVMAGGIPRFLTLAPPRWDLDLERLSTLFNERSKLMIINTPHNPTGKVLTRTELEAIRDLCERWDVYLVCDEIYEYLTYEGSVHVSPASIPGMGERTVTVSGFSKTYSVTGWRIGYCCAPVHLAEKMRKAHVYLTVCAPAPLQEGARAALALPAEYYDELRAAYGKRRALLLEALERCGFRAYPPEGAYFCMADFSALSDESDEAFCMTMAEEAGVIAAPGSSFHPGTGGGRTCVRFAFCKKDETLLEAAARLSSWRSSPK
jgi:aminotransferase